MGEQIILKTFIYVNQKTHIRTKSIHYYHHQQYYQVKLTKQHLSKIIQLKFTKFEITEIIVFIPNIKYTNLYCLIFSTILRDKKH